MAREYGCLWISIWNDDDFRALGSGPHRLYMLLVSQAGMSTCGVQSYAPRRWATLAPDTSARQIEASVSALEAKRFVLVDRQTDELLVRSHLRHDRALRTANVAKSLARTWRQVASPRLQSAVLVELQRHFDEEGNNGWPGWDLPEIRQMLSMNLLRKAG